MQVKELKNEGLQREYEVTIPANDIQEKADKKLDELAKTVKMDGFRPGKVPLKIVKQKYSGSVLGEVLENSVSESSQKLMDEKDIYPAVKPNIEVSSFDEGKDLVYKISVEIYPDVPKIDYTKIKLEKSVVDVSEDDIKDSFDRLKKMQKNFVPVKKERAAKEGDAVLIDFEGKIDGVAFEGGAGKDFRLELGSGQFIPGFEDQLVGAKKGDKKVVKVSFPENYGSKDLAGKASEFDVTIHDVLENEEVEINDEFAKKFGLESLDKLKEEITKQIENDFAGLTRMNLKKDLFDSLDGVCDFEIPKSMFDLEYNSLSKSLEKAEEGKELSKKEKEEQEKEYKSLSERRVRLGIVLADISRTNKLEVSEEELRKAVFEQARSYPGQEQQVIEFYQKNAQALEQLKGPILEDKAVDFILDKVSVSEKKVSSKELVEASEKQ